MEPLQGIIPVTGRRVRILSYDRITTDAAPGGGNPLSVSVEQFRRHMEALDRWGFSTITLSDFLLCRRGDLPYPRKPVILVFNNADRGIYDLVLPVVEPLGMCGVVFVSPAPSDGGEWLTDSQILEVRERGFEIGSCALGTSLYEGTDDATAWQLVSRSRIVLEILLNAPVRSFLYPNKPDHKHLRRMVADAGFSIACSLQAGSPDVGRDMYEVRAMRVFGRTGIPGLFLRLFAPYERAEHLVQRLLLRRRHRVTTSAIRENRPLARSRGVLPLTGDA